MNATDGGAPGLRLPPLLLFAIRTPTPAPLLLLLAVVSALVWMVITVLPPWK